MAWCGCLLLLCRYHCEGVGMRSILISLFGLFYTRVLERDGSLVILTVLQMRDSRQAFASRESARTVSCHVGWAVDLLRMMDRQFSNSLVTVPIRAGKDGAHREQRSSFVRTWPCETHIFHILWQDASLARICHVCHTRYCYRICWCLCVQILCGRSPDSCH